MDVFDVVNPDDSLIKKYKKHFKNVDSILVDERHFLKRKQVDELFLITKIYDFIVIAFGLRTDFKINRFDESTRLLELADELAEILTICRCKKKLVLMVEKWIMILLMYEKA